jgi:hypothetical protein
MAPGISFVETCHCGEPLSKERYLKLAKYVIGESLLSILNRSHIETDLITGTDL